MLPIISLIGRTNVGKSTLFNVLTKTRNALVANYPGLTRDRQYGSFYLTNSIKTIVIDTAGLDINIDKINTKIYEQTLLSIQECNIILFIVSARDGLTPQEYEISKIIRKHKKETILVINKIDGVKEKSLIYEFYSLGFINISLVSATHNQGIKNIISQYLIPWVNKNYKNGIIQNKKYQNAIKIAVIGKPNVGKSTLINGLLKQDRMITLNQPGTTIDSISTYLTYKNSNYMLIDTAGAMKKKNYHNNIQKFSIIKTLQSIEKSDISLLIIDAYANISSQDLFLADIIINAQKSIVIVINKWDLLTVSERKIFKNTLQIKLKFLSFSRIHFISALYKKRIFDLFQSIDEAYKNSIKTISTSKLTNLMYSATQKHPPPFMQGRRIKLKYAHLGSSNPLIIIIHGNQVKYLSSVYKKYLKNFFHNTLQIKGAPIFIKFKENINPYVKNHEF